MSQTENDHSTGNDQRSVITKKLKEYTFIPIIIVNGMSQTLLLFYSIIYVLVWTWIIIIYDRTILTSVVVFREKSFIFQCTRIKKRSMTRDTVG